MLTGPVRGYLRGMRDLRRLSAATAFDIALVLFITVTTVTHVYDDSDPSTHIAGPRWLALALPLLIALPLLWRRTRPLLVCALVLGGIVLHAVVSGHSPEGFQFILIWVVVPYSVAAYSGRRDALIGLAIVLTGF